MDLPHEVDLAPDVIQTEAHMKAPLKRLGHALCHLDEGNDVHIGLNDYLVWDRLNLLPHNV